MPSSSTLLRPAAPRRPRAAATAVALVALVFLGGCTALGNDEEPAPAASSAEPEAEAEEQLDAAAETLSSGSESPEPTPVEDLPVVETRTASHDSQPIEVSLNGVQVDGGVMSVIFTVRNAGQERIALTSAFDDSIGNAVADGADVSPLDNLGTADGVYVLDGTNGKRHVVARDSSGACVCSSGLNGVFVSPDQQVVLSATFTAVPEDVDTVSVVIPLAGEFADVPVTR